MWKSGAHDVYCDVCGSQVASTEVINTTVGNSVIAETCPGCALRIVATIDGMLKTNPGPTGAKLQEARGEPATS